MVSHITQSQMKHRRKNDSVIFSSKDTKHLVDAQILESRVLDQKREDVVTREEFEVTENSGRAGTWGHQSRNCSTDMSHFRRNMVSKNKQQLKVWITPAFLAQTLGHSTEDEPPKGTESTHRGLKITSFKGSHSREEAGK